MDYGLQIVNPALIENDPPVEDDWKTTKDGGAGTDRDVIGDALVNLPQVRAKIEEGYGPKDFDKLRQSNDPNERAIGDSYSMFCGDDPIEVQRKGDKLVSADGRHRLNLADQYGLQEIPARVRAPEDDPEFADKPYDAAKQPSREEKDMNPEYHNRIEAPEAQPKQEQDPHLKHDPADQINKDQPQHLPDGSLAHPQTDSSGHQQADLSQTKSDPLHGGNSDTAADGLGAAGDDRMDGGNENQRQPESAEDPLDGSESAAEGGNGDADENLSAPSESSYI